MNFWQKSIRGVVLLDPAVGDNGGGGGGTGNTGVTQEQLHAAIEKARLEERTKLFETLETTRKQLEAATEAAKTKDSDLTQLNAKVTELTEKLKALQDATKPDGGIDVTKAIESAVGSALSRQEAVLGEQVKRLSEALQQEQNLRSTAEAAQLRVRLIAEAGGDAVLIPELVVGRTEEELKASIANSKAVFDRSISSRLGAGGGTASGTGLPVGGRTSASFAAGAGGESNNQVRRMSPAEYSKNREALRAKALAAAQGA